jgi:hypothetical protein
VPILGKRKACPLRSPAVLLLLCAAAAFGQSYEWVRTGARIENPVVLSLLLDYDLDTAEAAIRALAERPDQYVEDIISALLYQHSPWGERLAGEYLIRVTGRGAGGGEPDARAAARWARTNPAALDRLLAALPALGDGYARVAALRLAPMAGARRARPVLAVELAALAEALAARGGRASGAPRREIFAALAAAEALGGEELAPPVIEIARVSRDAEVVDEARRVAELLLRDDLPQRGDLQPQGAPLAHEQLADDLQIVAGRDVGGKRERGGHDAEKLGAPLVSHEKVEPGP